MPGAPIGGNLVAKLCTCGRPLPDKDGLSWDREELIVWRHTRATNLTAVQFDAFECLAHRLGRWTSIETIQTFLESRRSAAPDFVATIGLIYVTIYKLRKRLARLNLSIPPGTIDRQSRYMVFVEPWRE